MPKFHDCQRLPFTPAQLFALVADVGKYPEFLPWCRAARVWNKTDTGFEAELVIGFKGIRESYTSHITLRPDTEIDVTMLKGPFAYLTNRWRFVPIDGGTELTFDLDFRFSSRILETLIGSLFGRATEKMVNAFRRRAEVLYGG